MNGPSICLKAILNSNAPFFKFYRLCSISAWANWLFKTFLILRHCKKTFAKVFFFNFLFCERWICQNFWCTHNVICFHWFEFSNFLNVDWKGWFIFIRKNINANVLFCFSFTKFFFWYRKLNFSVIQIINKLFIFLGNSFWIYFYWINMPSMTPNKTFLIIILMLISPFLGYFNSTGNFM